MAQVPWSEFSNEEIEMYVRSGARLPLLETDPFDQILTHLNGIVDACLEPSAERRPTMATVNSQVSQFIRQLLSNH